MYGTRIEGPAIGGAIVLGLGFANGVSDVVTAHTPGNPSNVEIVDMPTCWYAGTCSAVDVAYSFEAEGIIPVVENRTDLYSLLGGTP